MDISCVFWKPLFMTTNLVMGNNSANAFQLMTPQQFCCLVPLQFALSISMRSVASVLQTVVLAWGRSCIALQCPTDWFRGTILCRAGVCKGRTAELRHQLQRACGDSAADSISGLGQRSAATEGHCKPHPGHYFALHVRCATCFPHSALLALTGL